MNLFQLGAFTGAAGKLLDWKIECDALTDEDWATVAEVSARRLMPFGRVVGVPTGGLKLAEKFERYVHPRSPCVLVVDDVWTTGKSLVYYASTLSPPWIGFVMFARAPIFLPNVKAFMTCSA